MTISRNVRSLAHGFTVAAAAFGLILLGTRINGAPAPQGGQTAATPARTIAGNVDNGKALFLTHQCWACHGYTGETGTRLIQDNGTFVARLFSVSSFINYIRAPRPNDPPPKRSVTIMPSYGVNSLPDQQAADLYAYIRTFKPTQPPLKDIPLLNQMLSEGGKVKK
jgi:mono/diheme cytochrome c family protein